MAFTISKSWYSKLQVGFHSKKSSRHQELDAPSSSGSSCSSSGKMSKDQRSWKDFPSKQKILASTRTKEGLKLVLISGDVLYCRADVIVNTVPENLQLGGGPLSLALLQKGGTMLQKELVKELVFSTQERKKDVGSIFMTRGYDLNCNAVLHVVAPNWDNGAGSSLQIMANIIKECLMTIEQKAFPSITFPMIGTGILKFPKDVFAELIFSEVLEFSSSGYQKSCQEVQFLILPSDEESHQAFLYEFSRQSSENPNKDRILMTGDNEGIIRTVSKFGHKGYEMKFGAVNFQVATGDITKEKTDVIVNSTIRTFDLKSGVSKAILEGAGPAVEKECAVLASQPHKDFIITQGGELMCKIIIHVLGGNDVRETVSSVLEESEQRRYKSVSLPAIGTGNAGKNPVSVADDILNAVVDFAEKYPSPSLKEVKVVIFLPKLLSIFYDSMKQRVSSTSLAPQFSLSTPTHNIPEYWTDMEEQLSCVVLLQPGQPEYNSVRDRLSPSYKIEKIERIQNPLLWHSYQLRKMHMDNKNGHTDNEKLLFHGTDGDSVPLVNQHGFNGSYAGKNGTAYGKGTYFSVDATYSANDQYSRPDSDGRKHIYIARVLTGTYTLGHAGLITPPSKSALSPTDLFDSVTDNTRHPHLFVVFFDNQAYPEYLITFKY